MSWLAPVLMGSIPCGCLAVSLVSVEWALAILGGASVVGLLVWRCVVLERRRPEELRQLADSLGFSFTELDEVGLERQLAGLRLFQQGRSRRAENVLSSSGRAGSETHVFDYQYVTGSGKNRTTHRQTVAAFALGRKSLPRFEVRPETLFHKIGAAFGYQDIDLPEHPAFSSRYVLRTSEEEDVRALFTGPRIAALEHARHISVECADGWLIVYRARRRLKPAEIPEFLEEARGILAVFTK